MGDFLATTDDSGELMDTFHLFGDEVGAADEGTGGGGEGDDNAQEEGGAEAKGLGPGAGQSVAKLKTLDGEAFCSCLEMCFEHMVSGVGGGGKQAWLCRVTEWSFLGVRGRG